MYYGVLPPEINSGRMYSGPGSGSMLAAAQAWEDLAAELHTTAQNYGSVVSTLASGPWTGPSSTAMTAAASPYLAWMTSTAAQAEQTGVQAKAATAAYTTAYAMMVPPAAITANRSQLLALVASNIFGQNTPAIAATEAEYERMWAQDAAAMYRYAADSQAVSQLAPFSAPRQNTNPGAAAAQSTAAGQSAGTSGGNTLVEIMRSLLSGTGLADFANLYNDAILFSIVGGNAMGLVGLLGASGLVGTAGAAGAAQVEDDLAESVVLVSGPETMGRAAASSASKALQAEVVAATGQADSLSGLTVPRGWTTAAPEMRLAAAEEPAPNFVVPRGTGGVFSEMPLFGGAPLMALPTRGAAAGTQPNRSPDVAKRKTDRTR